MKISASVYSNKEKTLENLVRELDALEIDMLHIDCADDDKVFKDITLIRKISATPIDLHIISFSPEKYFQKIEELKIEYVSFQYENLHQIPALPKNTNTKFGLSVVSSTSLNVFNKISGFDFAMFMSTVPGQSGGEFNRNSFQRIIEFKKRFPHINIHADGGITDEVAYILRLLGVQVAVSGSYLMNHHSLSAGILGFHKIKSRYTNFKVAEFATPVQYLPVLKKKSIDFKNVLKTIDEYAMGFVLVTDEQGQLSGIISNADVRKGLVKNLSDLNNVTADEILNSQPISIYESNNVSDIIRLLNRLKFIVLFLPVTDEQNILKGAVLLNNLTRV